MFNREWLLLRGPQIGYLSPPAWLLDTDLPAEPWQCQVRALALAWWLMDYGLAEALNPALEQARTILGVPL